MFTNEKYLISELRSGNESAFDYLFKSYFNRVVKLLYNVLKDQEAANDVAQETFLRAFENLTKFQEKSKIYTWLIGIALNLARNYKRKNAKVISIDTEYMQNWESNGITPEKEAEKKETVALVEKGLDKIRYKDRELLVLYYFENWSVKEIANVLSRPEGTIKSDLYYARKELRKYLETSDKVGIYGT